MSAVIKKSPLRQSQFVSGPGWGNTGRMPHGSTTSYAVATLAAVLVILLTQIAAAESSKEVRRILVFNDLGSISSPGFARIDQAIFAGLEKSPYQIEFYNENLETTLFSDADSQREFREWYVRKYRDRKPDVIIAVGRSSIKFLADSHESAFPNIPVIFCGSTESVIDELKPDSHFTGVWAVAEPEVTLNLALRLQPRTQHVVVVGGVGTFDRNAEAIVRKSLSAYESKLDFTYFTDLAMPVLLDRLKNLAPNTIVFHTALTEDAAGARFVDASQSVPMVAGAANAPVFVLDDVDLGTGAVGGYLLSWAATGDRAASMALRVLNGERPHDIPIEKTANAYIFDWRALRRWGLKESDLPPGSVVLHRHPSVWDLYKWYIIGGASLILLEAFLIFALLWQRTKRTKAEAELATAYERLRLAMAAGNTVGWDWDVQSGRDRWFGDLQTMFGIPSNTYSGNVEDFRRRIHPDDRELVWKAVADARQHKKQYVAEFRVVHPDGTVRWITANGKFYYAANGRPDRMLGMAVDITDRKQIEGKLRESEERFRLVANTAPVLIWMSSPDKLCTYFNQPWLEFTGRSIEEELGNGWSDGVHYEDLRMCLDTYAGAFDQRESFKMQYRLRRNDGEYRWVFNSGVPRFNQDGSFAGYIGSCIDVTERKLAEEALVSLSGRLINAQEEERKRIAREIHDDYNQRLALVAINLEELAEKIGDPPVEVSQQFRQIWNQIGEIGADLHSLSHRLHSSTLESLGLVEGAKAFCKEFAEQQEIQVDFADENVPRGIPGDVALCLFRITQEALRNIKRHSGADKAEVRIECLGERLHLSVADQGRGFNINQRSPQNGIGIRSMEERLRSLGGQLEIISRPAEGTRIDAWLPLQAA